MTFSLYQSWHQRLSSGSLYRKIRQFPERGHTKNVWLNFLPPRTNDTCCCPFTLISLLTPYGLIAVTLTSRLDTPGWSIDTFEPVSAIKHFSFPSISKETVGEPCSSGTKTVGRMTSFPGTSRWRELSSLSPLTRFPEPWFLCFLPFLSRDEVRHGANVNGMNVCSYFSFQVHSAFSRVLTSWRFPARSAIALRTRSTEVMFLLGRP